MTRQLENELRHALSARADELPAAAGERVRRHNYRPRTRDLRPPVAAGVLTAAAAAAAAVLVVGLGPRASEAFAGWTATPTTPAAGQLTSAETACRQRLDSMPTPPGAIANAPAVNTGGLDPVLADTRGPFTFVIFAGPRSSASCISGPGFTSTSATSSSPALAAVPAGHIAASAEYHTARAGHAYSFAEGHTGAGVTAVTLVLSDGIRVQTSAADGWFVAWWPGSSQVTSATVTSAQGTITQHLDAATGAGCPPAPSGADVMCAHGTGSREGVESGSMTALRGG
jgi:hypothetical protein